MTCALCGTMAKSLSDYTELSLHDDPRSSSCSSSSTNSSDSSPSSSAASETNFDSATLLDDNPRSCINADAASLVTRWSTLNPPTFVYKWICRPDPDDEEVQPFIEGLALHEALCRWVPPRPDIGHNLPITRYWAFFQFLDSVVAEVSGLPDFPEQNLM